VGEYRWLLLAHQLPTRSSNARVKTWRRLQQIGAVPSRNSVYVLPNTEPCREDFEWLRSEVVALGGEATVFAADAISEGGTEEIVAVFRRAREQEYRALKSDVDRLLPAGGKEKAWRASAKGRLASRTLRGLHDRLHAIERIDFFNAAARGETAVSLGRLERAVRGRQPSAAAAPAASSPAGFRGRRWVTRRRPGVDRMASAWLIRRFIDPAAEFAFVDHAGDTDVPFDMYSGEFSHHGDACTFEVLAERFQLRSAAVGTVGRLVHDLDMKDAKYGLPEAAAVGRMVEGLQALHADDATLLEHGIAMFDALARSFESDQENARPVDVKPGAGATKSARSARTRPSNKRR